MILILKIIHVLAFSVGIGMSVAHAVMGPRVARAEPAVAIQLGEVMALLGRIGAAAVVVLWITGGWMMYSIFGGAPGIGAFKLKILMVVLLTIAVATLQVVGIRARRAGTPPPRAVVSIVGALVLIFSILAVVFAILAFL